MKECRASVSSLAECLLVLLRPEKDESAGLDERVALLYLAEYLHEQRKRA